MKRYGKGLWMLLLGLVLLGFAACGSTQEEAEEPAMTEAPGFDEQTNQSAEYGGMVFQIPSEFEKDGDSYYAGEEEGQVSLTFSGIFGSLSDNTVPDYIDTYREQGLENITSEDETYITVDGASGRCVNFSGSLYGETMHYRAAFIHNDPASSVVILTLTQPARAAYDYTAEFDQIVSSGQLQ